MLLAESGSKGGEWRDIPWGVKICPLPTIHYYILCLGMDTYRIELMLYVMLIAHQFKKKIFLTHKYLPSY